jgi:hypothetical protein
MFGEEQSVAHSQRLRAQQGRCRGACLKTLLDDVAAETGAQVSGNDEAEVKQARGASDEVVR